MSAQTRVIVSWIIGIVVATPISTSMLAQQLAQSNEAQEPEKPFITDLKHIGAAEVSKVVNTGYFPSRQPKIYWHDQNWNIDLVIPSKGSENDAYSLRISSSSGTETIVELPEIYGQIDTIYRTPGDKVILNGECGGTCTGFLIVDLKQPKVIDDIGAEDVTISPDGRFILYDNAYPAHGGDHENRYHLYDTTKTARENVCGYMDNDPRHERLDEDMRGFEVYPQRPGQTLCSAPDEDDDNMATNFLWSEDSSKIVFADVKNGVMSMVLVTMPVGKSDLPKTSLYALTGAEDVCAGATDAAGEKSCDYHVIKSLDWDGDTVKAVFHHQLGVTLDLERAIPVSKFVPIGK